LIFLVFLAKLSTIVVAVGGGTRTPKKTPEIESYFVSNLQMSFAAFFMGPLFAGQRP
jgi:hypothetical protein